MFLEIARTLGNVGLAIDPENLARRVGDGDGVEEAPLSPLEVADRDDDDQLARQRGEPGDERVVSERRAISKCSTSCSTQKYGVSNSSWSRMRRAPPAAAARTGDSARAMLPAWSQTQAIWVTARVRMVMQSLPQVRAAWGAGGPVRAAVRPPR